MDAFDPELDAKPTNAGKSSDDPFKLSDVTKLDVCFWLLVANTCLIYGCVERWMKIGGSFLQNVYGFRHENANFLLNLYFIPLPHVWCVHVILI